MYSVLKFSLLKKKKINKNEIMQTQEQDNKLGKLLFHVHSLKLIVSKKPKNKIGLYTT